MFKTNFSLTTKFGGQCPPVTTNLGCGTKEGGRPLVYCTNFQGSHRLKQRLSKKQRFQEEERSETNLSTTVQRCIVVDWSYSALKICLTGQRTEITAASSQLEIVFKGFKIFSCVDLLLEHDLHFLW